MYDYGYDTAAGIFGGFAAITGIIMLVSTAVGLVLLISQWKVYKKAGKAGWECLIPIYNIIVLLQIVELPLWYIILFMVPVANIYAMFKIYIELAHKFGKSTGFGVGLTLLNIVFFPMLAFDKNSTYNGNNIQKTANEPQNNTYNPMNSIPFENSGVQVNNTVNNNIPVQETLAFNQNINTDINQFGTVQNNNLNNQVETSVVPALTQVEPNVLEMPTTEPTESTQPVNQELNIGVNMSTQESAPFTYNISEPVSPITETIQTNENILKQNVLVEPTPIVTPQPATNFVEPQNIQPVPVAPQPVLETPTLNVIPGMSPMPQPAVTPQSEVNNQNNTTM